MHLWGDTFGGLQQILSHHLSQLPNLPKPRDSGRGRAEVLLLPSHMFLLLQNPQNLQQQQIYGVQHFPARISCILSMPQPLLHKGQQLAAPSPPLLWALFIERHLLLPFFLFAEARLEAGTESTPAGSSQMPLAAHLRGQ